MPQYQTVFLSIEILIIKIRRSDGHETVFSYMNDREYCRE